MSREEKQEAIIKAALKRFSHFGVAKTTMNEIADDLSISKASLYYYYPDKLNLYAAVLQKIIATDKIKEEEYLKENDPSISLVNYIDKRTEFIIQHYNILEYLRAIGNDKPKELESIFNSARGLEITAISKILAKGVKSELLKVEDPNYTAELLLDCLDGLRLSVISNKTNFFPDKQQFFSLATREKEFVKIFIKGLSC